MLSLVHKFLFVHIPKTGGNSIQQVLVNFSEDRIVRVNDSQDGIERFGVFSELIPSRKHSAIGEYELMLDQNTFDRLFKFSCVRNPWERLISFYFSPHKGVTRWDRDLFVSLAKRVPPMVDYLRLSNDGSFSRSKGSLDVDCVMRFEYLQRDFNVVCDRLAIPRYKLPHRNRSLHDHYSKYYDDALVNLVNRLFAKDVELFRYKFQGG